MEVTDKMVKDAQRRWPHRICYDFVECISCGFVGLAELGSDDCPDCSMSGCLKFVDEDNPEYNL